MTAKLSRRRFLRATAMTAVGALAASCAQPTPEVIEKPVTVVVEKEVPIEKQVVSTVIVEKQVKETVIVEKVITATPLPPEYHEAPMLAELVAAGKLPPVAERLPEDPLVMEVVEKIGKYGGTWRRGYKGMADKWNAAKLEEGMLVRWRQPEGESLFISPYVCSKFDTNADATEFTWYLRKGIKWSDGAPLTTEDIRFWYEDLVLEGVIILDQIWKPGGQDMVIDIVDDYTFKTRFAVSNPIMPTWLASTEGLTSTRGPNFGGPAHYLRQFHPKYAKQADVDQAIKDFGVSNWQDLFGAWTNLNSMFVNTELPVIIAWKVTVPPPAERMVMERNPYFWQVDPAGNQLPYIDKVAMDLFENTEVLNFKVIKGEIDCQGRHINAVNYTLFRENEIKGDYRVVIWKMEGTFGYGINTAYGIDTDPVIHKLLNDVDFRRALSVAINRDEITDLIYNNLLTARQSSADPGTPEYDPEWEKSYAQYDPELANKMLDDLGLDKRDSDGFRLRSDGETLTLFLEFPELAMTGSLDQHEMIKDYWEAVGLKTLTQVVSRELSEERSAANQEMFSVWAWGFPIGFGMHGPAVDPPGQPYANWYLTEGKEGIKPPDDHPWWEISTLWDQITREPDSQKGQELWLRIRDIHKAQLWHIGVCGLGPALYITKNQLRNMPSGLIDSNTFRNIGLAMPQQFYFR